MPDRHRTRGNRAPGKLAALVALFLASPAEPAGRWHSQIAEASERFGVPEEWIRRVMRAESGGRTMLNGRLIASSAGAMGLMQLMPGTWREMRAAHRLGNDPHDPRDNVLAGAAYLRRLYDRFGYPGLFAAYNAGPGRYAQHLAHGRPLPAETVAYLEAVGGRSPWPAQKEQWRQTIFIALSHSSRDLGGDRGRKGAPNELFARTGNFYSRSADPAPPETPTGS